MKSGGCSPFALVSYLGDPPFHIKFKLAIMTIKNVHLLSKSIPRSGHHYFSKLLFEIYGESFFYCEFYQPNFTECCKAEPCNRPEKIFNSDCKELVSMQKGHDFFLTDIIFQTNQFLKYLIFFRNYVDSIKSYTNLYIIEECSEFLSRNSISSAEILKHHDKNLFQEALKLIDIHPQYICPEKYQNFLLNGANYHLNFIKKCGAVSCNPHYKSFVVNYEKLSNQNIEALLNSLIIFIGIEPKTNPSDALRAHPFSPKHNVKSSVSKQADTLLEKFNPLILDLQNQIHRW